MDADAVVRRAKRAQALMDSPEFREALDDLDARYVEAWRRSQLVEVREKWWAYISALSDIRKELERMVADAIPATTESKRISRTISHSKWSAG